MRGPAIDLQQVALTLGQTRILHDINLQVPAGSIHALIGPNGAGKSSLAGILPPIQFALPVPSGAAIILVAGSVFILSALARGFVPALKGTTA